MAWTRREKLLGHCAERHLAVNVGPTASFPESLHCDPAQTLLRGSSSPTVSFQSQRSPIFVVCNGHYLTFVFQQYLLLSHRRMPSLISALLLQWRAMLACRARGNLTCRSPHSLLPFSPSISLRVVSGPSNQRAYNHCTSQLGSYVLSLRLRPGFHQSLTRKDLRFVPSFSPRSDLTSQ